MSSDSYSEPTLSGLIACIDAFGDRPALVQVQDERAKVLTYTTLSEDIRRFAGGLGKLGLEPRDRAIFLAQSGPDWITAFLAVLASGGIPVPIDAQADEETLGHIVEHSAAKWAIADDSTEAQLHRVEFPGQVLKLDDSSDGESWRGIKADLQSRVATDFDPDDTAVLFYTSGTTGPPKGVPLSHANVAFQMRAIAETGLVSSEDRILQPLPLHHVYPLIVGTLAPLSLGLTIVMPEAMLGPQIVSAIQVGRVSFIVGVPRLYDALIATIESRIRGQSGPAAVLMRSAWWISRLIQRRFGWRAGRILLFPLHRRIGPTLQVMASGGAALNPQTAQKIEALGWRVASGYGLTETSPLLTINPPGSGRLDSAGRAIPGIDLRIDSTVAAQESSPDDGEILARGTGVFGGYLSEARDDDSFTADGWFRTKDIGHIDDDGHLIVSGRLNTLLVTGSGKKVQPDNLERRYAAHTLIEELGVLMDGDQLAAVVVPDLRAAREQNISPENAARLALSQTGRMLPGYQRIGRHVISREPLARTRLGKIQRHRLRERYRELRENPAYRAGLTAPQSLSEMSEADRRRLDDSRATQVWELLSQRYPRHGLTPDSSLQLDLGIDSLGWLELGTELSQQFGINLNEDEIAALDTVRDLLEHVAESTEDRADRQSPVEDPESYLSDEQRYWLKPLSPAVRRLANTLYAVHNTSVRMLFRLDVDGLEHIPANGQWILAPNHASFLDPSIIAASLPLRMLETTCWAGWTGYTFRNALFRGISRLAQIIPVDPDRGASSSLALAAAALGQGKNLIVFPEGERSATGELLELKPGIGMLASHFRQVSIIPAWIAGSFEAWPRDRALPKLRRISVRFDSTLQWQDAGGADSHPADTITAALTEALQSMRSESLNQAGDRAAS